MTDLQTIYEESIDECNFKASLNMLMTRVKEKVRFEQKQNWDREGGKVGPCSVRH